MADQQGQRQLRAGTVGPVAPSNETQSEDSKASVMAIAALQVAAQARIDRTRPANQIGAKP